MQSLCTSVCIPWRRKRPVPLRTVLSFCQKCLLSNLWLPICFWDFRQSNSIAYSFLRPFWPCWLAMKRTRSAFWTIRDYIFCIWDFCQSKSIARILSLDLFEMLLLAMKITRSAFWRTCDYISAFGTSVRALYRWIFIEKLQLAMKRTRSAFWRTCDYISAFGTSVRAL